MYELCVNELLWGVEFSPDKHPVWWQNATRDAYPYGLSITGLRWTPYMHEAAEIMSLPPSRGMSFKVFPNCAGHWYCGAPLAPWETVAEREQKFREYLRPWLQNPQEQWHKYQEELKADFEPIKAFDFEKARDHEISIFLDDVVWPFIRKAHRIHHLCMYPLSACYMMFEEMAREVFGLDPNSPAFRKLFQGFETENYIVDEKLWRLAQQAQRLGLKKTLVKSNTQEVLAELEQSSRGRIWKEEFTHFVQEHGWRNDTFDDASLPGWVDDPTLPLLHIRDMMGKKGELPVVEKRAALAKEREGLTKELIGKCPADQKDRFLSLLQLAQLNQVFSEEHTLFIEQPVNVIMWRFAMTMGKRFQRAGALDDWKDVFYLSYEEIKYRIIEYPICDFRKLVKRRKKLWKEAKEKEKETYYLGNPEILEVEPILKRVCGYGESIKQMEGAIVTGFPSSPGIAQGPARVITSYDELHTIKEGELLVAHLTWSTWTPIFPLIRGVVTEFGGMLSHTAVVAREYGIPAIVAAREVTKKIKTGQTIEINGNTGAVRILRG